MPEWGKGSDNVGKKNNLKYDWLIISPKTIGENILGKHKKHNFFKRGKNDKFGFCKIF